MNHILAKRLYHSILILTVLLVTACGGGQTLRGVLKKETPYEKYTSSLKSANLHDTALGRSWLEAGRRVLYDSVLIRLPFKEAGYFAAEQPRAVAYRFEAQRGERVIITLETTARENMQVFTDLYEVRPGRTEPELVLSADTSTSTLTYEVQDDLTHLLRIQPELLRSGQYTVTIDVQPTLAFPVPGRSSRNISSIWGDPRDAGARRHEGVDIFAPKGTPVIAAASGIVRGVSTTPRGGKVVWLLDTERRQSLYYAHLDEQLVTPGQQVQAGDTIGLIGNTGNAVSTAPHLHFGIYRFGKGATNPYPYLHQPKSAPAIKGNLAALGSWRRISARSANMRMQPSTKGGAALTLPQHTSLRILGVTDTWYRVQLPDGIEGYVATSVTESTANPIRQDKLVVSAPLLDEAHPLAAPKDSLPAGKQVAVLANYKNFKLVKVNDTETGWLSAP